MLKNKVLEQVSRELKKIDRTPAWLCRQAGIDKSNYTNIKKGHQRMSENIKQKFSDVLKIKKSKLFKKEC